MIENVTPPCPTCPWRRSSDPSGDEIPGFDLAKMRELENTVTSNGEDGFFVIMACHGSDEGKDQPCWGYVAQEGYSNIRLRLLATADPRIGPVFTSGPQDDLYDSYWEMRAAMEQAQGEDT